MAVTVTTFVLGAVGNPEITPMPEDDPLSVSDKPAGNTPVTVKDEGVKLAVIW